MQSPRLLHRIDVLYASPVMLAMEPADEDALRERLLAASSLDDLSDADRELLRDAALQVVAGRSHTLTDPSDWGDVSAVDAALERLDEDPQPEDVEALEAALDTIGGVHSVAAAVSARPDAEVVEGPYDDDGFPLADGDGEAKGFDFDDPDEVEWVGV